MERREARIRRIRDKLQHANRKTDEFLPGTPNVHHVIAKSQNRPEHIPSFLRKHVGDPAIAVC